MNIVEQLEKAQGNLRNNYINRSDESRILLLALLSQEHVLLIGSPGTAKTKMCQQWAESLGLSFFRRLLTQYSSPDEIFGPVDIKKLKDNGEFVRILTRRAADSQILLMDEVFKCSPSMLNSMLSLMEERIYDDGPEPVKVPLRTLIGTSNELPEPDQGLAAFYDRFLFRKIVPRINDRDQFKKLLWLNQQEIPVADFTEQDLDLIHTEINKLKLTVETVEALLICWERLLEEHIDVTDRRWKQLVNVMAADSWLKGYSYISATSITIGEYILWSDPKDIQLVKRICMESVNPTMAKALEIQSAARQRYAEWNKTKSDNHEVVLQVLTQLNTMSEELRELEKTNEDTGEITGVMSEITVFIETLLSTLKA